MVGLVRPNDIKRRRPNNFGTRVARTENLKTVEQIRKHIDVRGLQFIGPSGQFLKIVVSAVY